MGRSETTVTDLRSGPHRAPAPGPSLVLPGFSPWRPFSRLSRKTVVYVDKRMHLQILASQASDGRRTIDGYPERTAQCKTQTANKSISNMEAASPTTDSRRRNSSTTTTHSAGSRPSPRPAATLRRMHTIPTQRARESGDGR